MPGWLRQDCVVPLACAIALAAPVGGQGRRGRRQGGVSDSRRIRYDLFEVVAERV